MRPTRSGAAFLLLLAAGVLLTASATVPPVTTVPAFLTLDGTRYSPASDHRPTVYVFLATDCPVASRMAPTLARLARTYAKRGVRFFAVYSNETETVDGVRRHARARGLQAPLAIVRDTDSTLARTLGATTTPEAFLLDADRVVRYRGRIDDGDALNAAHRQDLALALDAVLAKKRVAVARARAFGCALRLASPTPSPVPQVRESDGPTYRRDIAPLLDRRCVECHRSGEVGPMPLDSYRQAASWAKAMKEFTARRQMPPWKADSHGEFLNERRLSESEIGLFAAWADAGAPEGALSVPPSVHPLFPKPGDWKMGQPDAVFRMPQPFSLPTEGRDIYRCFVLPNTATTDKWVSSIEFQPGNRAVVHHINVFLDTSGKARALDAADPAPGYLSPTPGNVPGFVSAGTLGGWIPGHTPWQLPEGVGNLLPRGADIVLEVHYITTGKPEQDQTRFGLRFVRGPVRKRLRLGEVTAKRIRIPAGETAYRIDTCEFVPDDIALLSVTPHMHYLGRQMTATAELPDGTTQKLVTVPDWDFAWQMSYRFKTPLHLPRNTRIDVSAVYDNSAANPRNPHKPPREIHEGERTTDEMCNLFVAYTLDAEDLTHPSAQ